MKRDFLTFADLTDDELRSLLDRAKALKEARNARREVRTLAGRTLILLFEKASTRTRLSFEAAIAQLGGHAITLSPDHSQLGRGEPLADTAKVASRYCDAIMMRTFADERLAEFARNATVPVINGLTDGAHPVQVLADVFTIEERLGKLKGLTVAFIGDGSSNMARSFLEAAPRFGFSLRVAAPKGYQPPPELVHPQLCSVSDSPAKAALGADVLVTDVWTSMGQEAEKAARLAAFSGYCVDQALLERASPKAFVLHCLPAHRGEEITAEVLDGPRSAAWDEAENRLHVQKALLETLVLAHERALGIGAQRSPAAGVTA
ncbi:MAG: ornithine carbamoyltransferase [Myxococcaceae bacterium]|nr:ornithine carbamoyltransferase [Myxococcaceae bacterium]